MRVKKRKVSGAMAMQKTQLEVLQHRSDELWRIA
jgi:hypothetical protein